MSSAVDSSTSAAAQTGGGDVKPITDMSTLKSTVKTYIALDKELKASSKIMSEMRKKRRACEASIQDWMHANKKRKIANKDGTIKLVTRKRKAPVNAEYVEQRCTEYFNGDERRAAEFTSTLFDNRPSMDVDVLKCGAAETSDASVQV